MHAKQGDRIVIDTTTLDALRRHGEVIEVMGTGRAGALPGPLAGRPRVGLLPGPDARVVSTD